MANLKAKWQDVCEDYMRAFFTQHGFHIEDDHYWIGGPGTILYINDYFIGMDVIRYAVDNQIPSDKFFEWYDRSVEVGLVTNGQSEISFKQYCEGKSWRYSDAELEHLKELHERVLRAQEELEKCIKEETC